jgi:molybdate transport system substrate-binding protein
MKAFVTRGLFTVFFLSSGQAAELKVAVAANFAAPMQEITAAFKRNTGHKAALSFGSTGKFYAQIKNGAPYQLLLSADSQTPLRLEQEGLTVVGTRTTYATGRLVLWSKQAKLVDAQGEVLRLGNFRRIALADPKLAPYGAATVEALSRLGLLAQLKPKFVQGENISQTYQFVATENAALGFVALSQVYSGGKIAEGSGWIVPAALHQPIRQDAVLLARGKDNPAAFELLSFLRSDIARRIMRAYGYEG